ncbi:MAG: HAD-IC family P-type ATPase [Sulfurimicrobium sp.]|nr:HAD-IC family P-type ATPase [Sulfurimicrobium sp.]
MNAHKNTTTTESPSPTAPPWATDGAKILAGIGVSLERGLDAHAVARNRKRFGPNQLRQARRRNAWHILLDQFASLMVALLAVAALIAYLTMDWVDGTAIVAVILINAAIGFTSELKAVRSMEALYRLGQTRTRVRRAGRIIEIPAVELVPGDIVAIEAGDMITADVRLISASRLQADESALTGESLAVNKAIDPLPDQTILAERRNMLFKGTAVTLGSAEGVVVATGLDSELGKISSLVLETDSSDTPLEKQLEHLSWRLVWITLALTAALAATGIAAGHDIVLMLQTAIALAVATVPEGLPVVATIALARGMWRMARRNALVNRLSAVETLGATGIICTDKTGTLTENRMTVTRLILPAGELDVSGENGFLRAGKAFDPALDAAFRAAIEVCVLCNNAELDTDRNEKTGKHVGDPMETALLALGRKAGLERAALLAEQEEVREEAFDPQTKMMATFHRHNGQLGIAVKGAPEAVLSACSAFLSADGEERLDAGKKQFWLDQNQKMAGEGLRVLVLATRQADSIDTLPYSKLTFLGLVGLTDPPRAEVRAAIEECRSAGIRVVMFTGDQPATARHVARAVGLADTAADEIILGEELEPAGRLTPAAQARILAASIFARVSPKQKLDLVEIHQNNGMVVAMTGDGVNDAPALKKADIGVAMGLRGTQVAREAADMVLKDDAFSSIVTAVRQGRIIFDNIRKFVLYLLSCNVSEILVVAGATLVNAPLPLLPLQILFLNLVTDVFPAMALGVGPGDPNIMRRPPRPASEPILARRHWIAVASYGVLIALSVLAAFALAFRLGYTQQEAVTLSFLTLAFAQLWHVFNMRRAGSGMLVNDITRNPYVWGALALCIALFALALYLPVLAGLLQLTPPDTTGWAIILGFSLIPLFLGQFYLWSRRHMSAMQNKS